MDFISLILSKSELNLISLSIEFWVAKVSLFFPFTRFKDVLALLSTFVFNGKPKFVQITASVCGMCHFSLAPSVIFVLSLVFSTLSRMYWGMVFSVLVMLGV